MIRRQRRLCSRLRGAISGLLQAATHAEAAARCASFVVCVRETRRQREAQPWLTRGMQQGRESLANLLRDGSEPWNKWLDPQTSAGASWVQLTFTDGVEAAATASVSLADAHAQPAAEASLVCRCGSMLRLTSEMTECDHCSAPSALHCSNCGHDFCRQCYSPRRVPIEPVGGARASS